MLQVFLEMMPERTRTMALVTIPASRNKRGRVNMVPPIMLFTRANIVLVDEFFFVWTATDGLFSSDIVNKSILIRLIQLT